uniref:Chitobiosyldiphosphodolichol beta-mannosyltransferase n=1 Tax=Panagrolaimus davidi TaxID=227884 RepID=A0A914RA18_9BILA
MHPAIVVVLGDIGHSPRMCFHVMSLTAKGIPVQYVGYQESRPNDRLLNDPLVTIIPISPPSPFISNLPSIISLCFKLIWMCGTLISTLFFKTASSASLILVQNPPGVPTLWFGYFASKIKGATFVIDWHNYTSSIIQYNYDLNNDNKSLTYIQMILKFIAGCIASFEGYFGRRAKFNFCVSNSMRIDLKNKWNVKAITHYDRPPSWKFRCLTIEDKHQFFWKLCQHPDFASLISQKQEFDKSSTETTLFSYRDKDGVSRLRNDRPLLLISSTSWTKDEDFGILLDALRKFDTSPPPKRSSLMLPKIFVVITGKGPMKEQYLQTMNKIRWRYVTIVTPWLEAEDYPIMLGCADLGVSLHASTSGLDLPMKVVDMLGCRVPVLAKKFDAIGELVKPTNGKLFKSMEELCNLLVEMSGGFPESSKVLTDLKNQLLEEHPGSWEAQWDANFWPPIENLLMSKLHEKRRRERFSDDGYSEESD